MSEINYSGYNYPPTFIFPDRINIPKEFEVQYFDDNELLKFKTDSYGRLSIIELSKAPYISYEYFNWEYKKEDSKYKWHYISSSGEIAYKLYPSGNIIPISGTTNLWTQPYISGYLMHGKLKDNGIHEANYSGYFIEDTFVRVDIPGNPTGWLKNNDPYPIFGTVSKPNYSDLLKKQYIPIKLMVGTEREQSSDTVEAFDMTFYKENKIPILDRNYVNNVQSLEFYFDGRNIITNYNFDDIALQNNVHVQYEYTVDKIKVAAKLYTNKKGQSEFTPVIDNYIVKISTQRINK